jgi:hypothetical protein
MALLIAALVQAAAPSEELPEYVLKAGFLFNFAKYVEWPAEAFDAPESPIIVGVIGADPFGGTLEKALKGRRLGSRPLAIERFRGLDDLGRCHILFIPRGEKGATPLILEKTAEWPLLAVGETEDFARSGGAVGILIENAKPKLQVNPAAAARARLTIDSRLLKLAELVKEEK